MNRSRSDLSVNISDVYISSRVIIAGLLFLCFIAGFSLLWIPPMIIFGLAIIGVLAVFCVRWPYAGLLLYMVMEYLRPTERYPMFAPLHLVRIVALFVLIGWLIRRKRDGFNIWVKAPENAAVFGMLVVVILSVPFAFWKARAFDTGLDFIRTAIVFLLIANIVNTPRRLAGYAVTFILLNVFISGEQLFNYAFHGKIIGEGIVRMGGASGSFLGEDGDFALAMNVALPYVYFLAWSGIKPVLRVMSAIASLMFIASVVATGSRGGAVGLAAVLLTLTIRTRKRALAVFLIVSIALITWVISPPAYKNRISTIVQSHTQDLTVNSRLISWKAARQMFIEHPIIGVGAGCFLVAFIGRYGGAYQWSRTTHNIFYQTAAELGICGFIVFIFLLGCVLIRSVRLNARLVKLGLGGTPMSAYAAALLPSTVAFLVSGSFQTPLYYPHIYLTAALALALNNVARPMVSESEKMEVYSKWRPRPIKRRYTTV